MKDQDKNRDPERARKRAVNDFKCAVRKLGLEEAQRLLASIAAADRSERRSA